MSKPLNPGRKAVELNPPARPSRIRRDPPARPVEKVINPYPTEREAWVVVIGVLSFALAIAIIIIGFSDYTSK
ncbi:MAG TPA: hypothetical protein VM346_07350 [Sphingomicrobium sp.]|nr:hypothetical protein [Sphingomicrobium sp.]